MPKLMLGINNTPEWLVQIDPGYNKEKFKFFVENGCWYGLFQNNHVTIFGCPGGEYSSLEKVEILSDNQDRLRGDWSSVFENFHNPDYIVPLTNRPMVNFDDMDDDIPF